MNPRAGMNGVEERKYLAIAEDPTPVVQPVVCHVLDLCAVYYPYLRYL
jgi:hypothetical protein